MHLAQLDQAVEDLLPQPVAREIVVGDEELGDALRPVLAHHLLDVVGRAVTRLAALHVDDRAERALERAAAPGVEAGVGAGGALDVFARQEGDRRAADIGKIIHVIVLRLEPAGGGVLQQQVEPPFGLAGHDRDAQIARTIKVHGLAVQHRQAAGGVEAAEHYRDARLPERPRDVERARILVGLHAHQSQHPELAAALEAPDQLRDVHAGIGLVDHLDVELDVRSEHLPLRAIDREPVDRGERIGRDQRPPPADDVAVVVVMRRLDQQQEKLAHRPLVRRNHIPWAAIGSRLSWPSRGRSPLAQNAALPKANLTRAAAMPTPLPSRGRAR